MPDKFVQVIREDASPGPLYGPYEYAEAEEVLFAVLGQTRKEREGRLWFGGIEITDEVRKAVELDGSWEFDGGGGVYIVQAEQYAPAEENEEA